jgi:hypothetical protein
MDGGGQSGQQLAEIGGPLQGGAEGGEQLVAVDPVAEHPAVRDPLQPAAQRLEGERGPIVTATASWTGSRSPSAIPGAAAAAAYRAAMPSDRTP